MGKKMLFIINPKAGKAQIKNSLLQILNIFTKENYEIVAYPTQSHEDARRITRERAKEFDLVVCSGGDGTLNEVVSGMMESKKIIPIGYIPAGTTNDFANSLHIPKNSIDAANAIIDGEICLYDVGAFNGDYFIYVAAFGLFTDVPYQTKQEVKNVLGYLAYVLEGMKRLNKIKSHRVKLEYNDQMLVDDFLFGMITNSNSIGGFKNITDLDALLNDGLFEVTMIKNPTSALELQEIISSLLQEYPSEYVLTFKTSHLAVSGEEKISWTLDGEFGGAHDRVEINNMKEAISIITPKSV
ncbi:MAG TPA: diacylglycerol kinase [Clostridiales bacterium]|nr:YegS/Rv2252/BmrU family lipid kinase [Clostridia bacterium]HCS73822.1 diacylglycerol kinase [Clostridiales bacterium]